MLIDVVYNHLGPGRELPRRLRPLLQRSVTRRRGAKRSTSTAPTRTGARFFRDNALVLAARFSHRWTAPRRHPDHLRLGRAALSRRNQRRAPRGARAARPAASFVIAESDLNDVRVIQPAERYGFGFDAQWCDDFTTQYRASVTGARHGYFEEYRPAGRLAKAITRKASSTTGEYAPHRGSATAIRRRASRDRNSVVFVQTTIRSPTHGTAVASPRSPPGSTEARRRRSSSLHPGVPMLFMGQE